MIKTFGSCIEERSPVIESAEFVLKVSIDNQSEFSFLTHLQDNPHVQLSLAGIEDVADEVDMFLFWIDASVSVP